jgi:hypothetical protein
MALDWFKKTNCKWAFRYILTWQKEAKEHVVKHSLFFCRNFAAVEKLKTAAK